MTGASLVMGLDSCLRRTIENCSSRRVDLCFFTQSRGYLAQRSAEIVYFSPAPATGKLQITGVAQKLSSKPQWNLHCKGQKSNSSRPGILA